MNPKLSIIVPIYKVEPYLRVCLDSILRQKFIDFELILVDDGSPDNCGKICDEYALSDSRIIVIHKENGGVSIARNTGLEIARGEYITFVDPDDELGETYEINMHILLNNLTIDILQFPYYWDNSKMVAVNCDTFFISFSKIVEAWKDNIITCLLWHKIFKKNVWENIRFPENKVFEDYYIIGDIISNVNCVYCSTKGNYFYKIREGSITKGATTLKKELDLITAKIHIYKTLSKNGVCARIKWLTFTNAFRECIRLQRKFRNLDIQQNFTELKNNIPSFFTLFNISFPLKSKIFFAKFILSYSLLHICSAKLFIRILRLLK